MKARYLLSGIAASALLVSSAIAQQSPSTTTAPAATTTTTTTTPMNTTGQWRASKLIGVDVYNQANENVGEINDLLLDKSGRVAGVVIGVGGFLGMGERYVMVPMDRLSFTDTSTTGTASADSRWYPERAVYNATKDQLKSLPEFKYN